MFTGIVEESGTVVRLEKMAEVALLEIAAARVLEDATIGGSIAVDGCCLTIVDHNAETFTVEVMPETLGKTCLGRRNAGDEVNLERAVKADGRLDGHLVQGHIDGTGTIRSREPGDRWDVVTIDIPHDLARYVATKGSIAVDGVSLTVVDVDDSALDNSAFRVALIPTTLRLTTLGQRGPGEPVNLEVDVLSKYVERLMTHAAVAG